MRFVQLARTLQQHQEQRLAGAQMMRIVCLAAASVALQQPPRRAALHRLHAAKEIATFDPEEFALPSGEWPYSAADLNRLDNSDDAAFYAEPRFVKHVDDRAIESLTAFYWEEFLAMGGADRELDVLDTCSSWISHFPEPVRLGRIAGLGLNALELEANEALTESVVQDLNSNTVLPYDDDSFDVVANCVSVDYLTSPKEYFEEVHRVLRPGGRALITFSNRCFQTKAVAMWLQADEIDKLTIVASYLHYAATWKSLAALDLALPKLALPARPSPGEMMKNPSTAVAWASATAAAQRANSGDPMFAVRAVKSRPTKSRRAADSTDEVI